MDDALRGDELFAVSLMLGEEQQEFSHPQHKILKLFFAV